MTRPLHTLVQLSDLHVDASGPLYGKVDALARFRAAVDIVLAMETRPEAVLLTGDLVNDGSPEAYRAVREVLEPALRELGVPLLVIPGNHDDVPALRELIFDDTDSTGPLDGVLWVGGLRVVGLDSSIAGSGAGEVTEQQLAWLRCELREPAEHGTILAIHHPPLPSPVGLFEHLALAEPEGVLEIIRECDVRLVVCGHMHHVASGSAAGVPVWIAPSVAYGADVTAGHEVFRGIVGGSGLTRLDVFPDAVVATYVPLDGREPLVELSVEAAMRGD